MGHMHMLMPPTESTSREAGRFLHWYIGRTHSVAPRHAWHHLRGTVHVTNTPTPTVRIRSHPVHRLGRITAPGAHPVRIPAHRPLRLSHPVSVSVAVRWSPVKGLSGWAVLQENTLFGSARMIRGRVSCCAVSTKRQAAGQLICRYLPVDLAICFFCA